MPRSWSVFGSLKEKTHRRRPERINFVPARGSLRGIVFEGCGPVSAVRRKRDGWRSCLRGCAGEDCARRASCAIESARRVDLPPQETARPFAVGVCTMYSIYFETTDNAQVQTPVGEARSRCALSYSLCFLAR